MIVQTRLRALRPVDALVIAFLFLLSVIILLFTRRASDAVLMIALNAGTCIAVAALASRAEAGPGKLLRFVHDWYPVVMIFLVFKEVYVIIQSDQRLDWDALFISIDHAIFGVHPTRWLAQYSTPAITEILQIAYASYYFIMLTVGIGVFMRDGREKFSYVLFVITYGFFISYLGYIAFPAVGPRFTLHSFDSLDAELPGLWLTGPIRAFLNAGESIPRGAVHALAIAQRDAFPSGHTEMTLISLYLATRFRLRSRYILYVFGTLLIISTVYLRYHYFIDLVGGAVAMGVTVWTSPLLVEGWQAVSGRERGAIREDSGRLMQDGIP